MEAEESVAHPTETYWYTVSVKDQARREVVVL